MASSQAGPAFQLKHRIVGALILVSVGIVALPLILGSPNPELVSDVPDEPLAAETDTRVFVSKITPIGGATPVIERSPTPTARSPGGPAPRTAPPPQVPARKPASPATPPAGERATEPAKKPKAVAEAKPVPDRGWVVQVGTFGNPDNVKRVIKDLRAQGLTPSSTPVRTKGGPATRIWVGPYAQRVDAARVRARIQQSLGTKGLITSYP